MIEYWTELDSFTFKKQKRMKSKNKRKKKIIFGKFKEYRCLICDTSCFEEPLEPVLRDDMSLFVLCKSCKERIVQKFGYVPLNLPEMLNKKPYYPEIEKVEVEERTRRKRISIL